MIKKIIILSILVSVYPGWAMSLTRDRVKELYKLLTTAFDAASIKSTGGQYYKQFSSYLSLCERIINSPSEGEFIYYLDKEDEQCILELLKEK